MTDDCAFCRIARDQALASRVYEDKEVMAFLDFRPVSEGHTLVATKKHYENIFEVPDEEVAYLFKIVKKMALAIKKGVGADGISIAQNNGAAAHQVVFHFHVHVIPRYEMREAHRPSEAQRKDNLERTAEKIREFV
jgi:diadenosine tetraphosphate (Ap4A) HIT family hydrolase